MAILFPDEQEMPNSSLAHYLALAVRHFGTPNSAWYVDPAGHGHRGAARDAARGRAQRRALRRAGRQLQLRAPVRRAGCRGECFRLPAGSRILDTGGYKGHSRELPLEAFYAELTDALGVPRERCINMYGMTELSTQLYDDGNAVVPSVKSGPHWIRSRLVDPLTGREVPRGERGVLVHCDLANFNSVTSILTEDVGLAVDGGFLLLGRAEGAQAKGCSLAVEEFLRASEA